MEYRHTTSVRKYILDFFDQATVFIDRCKTEILKTTILKYSMYMQSRVSLADFFLMFLTEWDTKKGTFVNTY